MRTSHRVALSLALVALTALMLASLAASRAAPRGAGAAGGSAALSSPPAPSPATSTRPGPLRHSASPRAQAGEGAFLAGAAPAGWPPRREGRFARVLGSGAARPDDAPARGAAARAPTPGRPPTPLTLDPLRIAPDGLSVEVTGYDKRGPRALALWRLRDGSAAVVARGRSRRDGAIEFPRIVPPHTGLVLVATPAWETPDGPRASPLQSVAPRPPVTRPPVDSARRPWTPPAAPVTPGRSITTQREGEPT